MGGIRDTSVHKPPGRAPKTTPSNNDQLLLLLGTPGDGCYFSKSQQKEQLLLVGVWLSFFLGRCLAWRLLGRSSQVLPGLWVAFLTDWLPRSSLSLSIYLSIYLSFSCTPTHHLHPSPHPIFRPSCSVTEPSTSAEPPTTEPRTGPWGGEERRCGGSIWRCLDVDLGDLEMYTLGFKDYTKNGL